MKKAALKEFGKPKFYKNVIINRSMEEKIYFVTGNKDKLREAQTMWSKIEGLEIDLDEIQEMDGEKIIEAKLKEAVKQKPGIDLIVEDQSLIIDGMGGLPGR